MIDPKTGLEICCSTCDHFTETTINDNPIEPSFITDCDAEDYNDSYTIKYTCKNYNWWKPKKELISKEK